MSICCCTSDGSGGARALTETGGYYVQPTIFAAVSNDMTIAREEIFGPVLSVLSFTDAADAVRQAKQSGIGRDKSLHAFDKYLELKTTWIRIDSPL